MDEASSIIEEAKRLGYVGTTVECLYLEVGNEKDFMEGGMGESPTPPRRRLLARLAEELGQRAVAEPKPRRAGRLGATIALA
jgi:hypothetical protein